VIISTLLAFGVLVAGCSGGGYHYVKSSEDKTYFKVPSRWTLFDEGDIIDGFGRDLTDSERRAELDGAWQVAFDAAPKPSLEHVVDARADHPSGLAVVRSLDFDTADAISTSSLRNFFVDIDTGLQEGTADVTEYEELQLDGGFRGIHMVATVEVSGRPMTIDQTMLLDQATTKLYVLLVSCSNVCYEDNEGQIQRVVDSWTVRKT
jgi:hypothetical protein